MRMRAAKPALLLAAAALALGMTACTDESPPASQPAAEASAAAVETGTAEDRDEYAFGTNRDEIAFSIEQAFATDNGRASWEGDTLVLAVDGDASAALAGFTQCRVLAELLLEGDGSVIAFPNGRVDCADVLGG